MAGRTSLDGRLPTKRRHGGTSLYADSKGSNYERNFRDGKLVHVSFWLRCSGARCFCVRLSSAGNGAARRESPGSRRTVRRIAGPPERDHRCQWCPGCAYHADPGGRRTPCRGRSGAHRSDGDLSALGGPFGSSIQRMVRAQWQRGDDRHNLDRGIRFSRGADCNHQHSQCRGGA